MNRDANAPQPAEAAPTAPAAPPAGAARVPSPPVVRAVAPSACGRRKILFFAANGDPGRVIAIGQEHDAIVASIGASRHREPFELIARLSGRLSDLHQALLDHAPDIVHFACHGSSRAELVLIADDGGPAPFPAAALAELFRVLHDRLALVVFNACFSSAQAAAIRGSVPLAIGMDRPIEDAAAIPFAAELYRQLAAGRSVQDAFDVAAAAIQACPGAPGPQLTGEPRTLHLVDDVAAAPPRPRRWLRLTLAVAGAAAALALALHARSASRDRRAEPPGMVGFAAAEVRLGVFAPGARPAACRAVSAAEDCAELDHPERVAPTLLAAFDLDRHEVSNAEFAAWLDANRALWRLAANGIVTTAQDPPVALLRTETCGDGLTIAADRARVPAEAARWPVVCVSWDGASEYCRGHGKRLPLEAEWELAAKGAAGRPFPWGSELPQHDGVAFELRRGTEIHPRAVGSSPQDVSPEGVADLGGNVAEWVEDRRGAPHARTLRGGSFASLGPCHLLGSGCSHIPPDKFQKDIGFRCARSARDPQRDPQQEDR